MAIMANLQIPMDTTQARFLRTCRDNIGLDIAEAATLVRASPRSWLGWEAGTRPMPQAKRELLTQKLQNLGSNKLGQELVVVLANNGGFQCAIDVVSADTFLGLKPVDQHRCEIKSLAIDPATKRPYVHRTVFEVADNPQVLSLTAHWRSLVDD